MGQFPVKLICSFDAHFEKQKLCLIPSLILELSCPQEGFFPVKPPTSTYQLWVEDAKFEF